MAAPQSIPICEKCGRPKSRLIGPYFDESGKLIQEFAHEVGEECEEPKQ